MQKITWRWAEVDKDGEPKTDEDGRDVVATYHGINLGPVVKADKTMLVVYCIDGFVREVAIDEIIPY